MKKVINILFSLLKYFLLVVSLGLTIFIILRMYTRLGKSLTDAVSIFLPYGILLILFIVNGILKRDSIKNNIFFNITATTVFLTNVVVCVRSVLDTNMLFNGIQKMGVNFNFFNDYLSFNRIMLYGLIVADIVFMLIPNEKKEEEKKVVVEKKEVEPKKTVIEKVEMDDELI